MSTSHDTTEVAPLSPARDLSKLFSPKSIAIVGASRRAGSVGHAVMSNLVHSDFTGVLYPLNPKAHSVNGIPCVHYIEDLPETPDLAIMCVPPKVVIESMKHAAEFGTKDFIVISAGFKEIGGEGTELEQELRKVIEEYQLNAVGPNCLGLINTDPEISMNATFARGSVASGGLGLISQSGALCTALLDYAKGRGIGFSRVASFGNKIDVTEMDLMRSFYEDPRTRVIVMYMEELSAGHDFVDAAVQITRGKDPKPIVAIKSGRTEQGAAAAASHTGSLAGSDEVYEAILRQAGVIRVESVQELFDYAEMFTDPAVPAGRRTAIVTNAGGPGIMATDACIRYELKLAKFQDYTIKSLKHQMPATAAINNPVDVIGDARHDRYQAAMDAVIADETVDQIVVIVTPQNMTNVNEIAKVICEAKSFTDKPIVGVLMGSHDMAEGIEMLKQQGVPHYAFPEDAMRAMATKCRFVEWRGMTILGYRKFDADREAVTRIIEAEREAGRNHLIEVKALEVLEAYGFPVVPWKLAEDADAAVQAAQEMGMPVAMKIVGPEILHKTDVGGVKLNLTSAEQVRDSYNAMLEQVRSHVGDETEIWGVLIQKMIGGGKETILGLTRDPKFGPMLMFGLGGIYTEALRDVSFRLAPINERSAKVMVQSIRAAKLLEGVRGEAPADTDAIAENLQRLSQLVTDHASIRELDINPLMVFDKGQGAMVADARIILDA